MEQDKATGTELQTRQQQLLATLPPGLMNALSSAEARLEPCGAKTGSTLLTSCLTLVAPTGMTARERQDWLAVARMDLRGVPEDLLERGCAYARKTADHPAKVLPAIFKEIGPVWEARKRALRTIGQEIADWRRAQEQAALPPPDQCTPEDAARIIAEVAAEKRMAE